MTATAVAPRRTQAQRTAKTTGLLLDATLDCLAELGYAGTTTTVVAARAGVSRGAQLHHFPTRASLVAAAIAHLFSEMTSAYQIAFARLDGETDRLTAALDLLWTMFTHPHYPAVTELHTAARTDPELHAALLPVAEAHRANVHRLAAEYFPSAARNRARFDATLAMLLDTLHGMVVSREAFGDGIDIEAERQVFAETALILIAGLEQQTAKSEDLN